MLKCIFFFNLYIKSLYLNIQIILIFTSVKKYKSKNVKNRITLVFRWSDLMYIFKKIL